ncbi:XRE family transcriptional regulator [Lactococcus petauri]|uniref:XRE family transcriptional regulator n=1 Tax=Lactococcus petauri TaxID=1940789 RepID=UPI00254D6AA7|nr:XRE family transcriptional regulator [Lactococcus petauri]
MTKTKLQIMREKKGKTRKELVKKIEENHTDFRSLLMIAIVDWENRKFGYIDAFVENFIDKCAQALGCSVDELVEDKK